MKIKEFEALTLKDCLQQARNELGPDAVILETRKIVKSGLMGWGAKEAVRIVAATGITVTDPPARSAARRAADARARERADAEDPREESPDSSAERRHDPEPSRPQPEGGANERGGKTRSRGAAPAWGAAIRDETFDTPAQAPRREPANAEAFFMQRADTGGQSRRPADSGGQSRHPVDLGLSGASNHQGQNVRGEREEARFSALIPDRLDPADVSGVGVPSLAESRPSSLPVGIERPDAVRRGDSGGAGKELSALLRARADSEGQPRRLADTGLSREQEEAVFSALQDALQQPRKLAGRDDRAESSMSGAVMNHGQNARRDHQDDERPSSFILHPSSFPEAPATQAKLARLEQEMQELRMGMNAMRSAAGQPAAAPLAQPIAHPELYHRLRGADVPEETTIELLHALPDLSAWGPQARGPMAESALRDLLAGRIPVAGPIALTPTKPKVVALVGPTGVGKTTTIAKLAAHFALVEKRRVGLLTMDTYRIAAVEQLKTYSQIMQIPVQVAYSQNDVAPALERFRGYDLVLIDTAGRSHRNIMQVSELKTLVEAADCETHLVLAASTKERDLFDQIERFSAAGVARLLFTKLDETLTYGTMYTVATRTQIPVSYVTTGQKVPEDIEVASGTSCAALVMNGAAA